MKRYAPLFDGRSWVRFITLTMRRAPEGELRDAIVYIRKAARRMRAKFPALFAGGVYSVETKYRRADRNGRAGWHVHVHVLAWGPATAYTPHDELRAAWIAATRGRGSVVDVRAARRGADGTYGASLREAIKYVTKGAGGEHGTDASRSPVEGWPPHALREFLTATKSSRLYQTFGEAHGGELPAVEPCTCEHCGKVARPIEDQREAVPLSRVEAQFYLRGDAKVRRDGRWTFTLVPGEPLERQLAPPA